jgi:hypothetical protein
MRIHPEGCVGITLGLDDNSEREQPVGGHYFTNLFDKPPCSCGPYVRGAEENAKPANAFAEK